MPVRLSRWRRGDGLRCWGRGGARHRRGGLVPINEENCLARVAEAKLAGCSRLDPGAVSCRIALRKLIAELGVTRFGFLQCRLLCVNLIAQALLFPALLD